MAALNFPTTPTDKQLYSDTAGRTYRYDSALAAWRSLVPKFGGVQLVDFTYDGGDAITSSDPTVTATAAAQLILAPGGGSPKAVLLDAKQSLTNKNIVHGQLDDPDFTSGYTEKAFSITDGTNVDIDPSNGTIQTWEPGGNRAPTATYFKEGQSVQLHITAGANTIDWGNLGGPIPVKIVGGTAPTLSSTGETLIVLWKKDRQIYLNCLGDPS